VGRTSITRPDSDGRLQEAYWEMTALQVISSHAIRGPEANRLFYPRLNVRLWHLADINLDAEHVRFRG